MTVWSLHGNPAKKNKKQKQASRWTKVGGRRSDILRYGGNDCDQNQNIQPKGME